MVECIDVHVPVCLTFMPVVGLLCYSSAAVIPSGIDRMENEPIRASGTKELLLLEARHMHCTRGRMRGAMGKKKKKK